MKRHPLNAKGDFFVECDSCLSCDAPASEAPELIDYDEDGHCYFKRQPETPEEIDHAVNAVWVSCVEAVHYAGNDPEILAKIEAKNTRHVVSDSFTESLLTRLFNSCSRVWDRLKQRR